MSRSRVTDEEKLAHCILQLVGQTGSLPETNNWRHTEAGMALTQAGIEGFETDLVPMPDDELKALVIPAFEYISPHDSSRITRPERQIPQSIYGKLRALKAFYHAKRREAKGNISMAKVTREQFDHFRVADYMPSEEIIPWNRPLASTDTRAREIENWKKLTKPNKSEYKKFNNDYFWVIWREKFENIARAQGVHHLIDPDFEPTNSELDERQREWMFTVLEDVLVSPQARLIVKAGIEEKDTRKIWRVLCTKMEKSRASETKANELSERLIGDRLKHGNFKGSDTEWIARWSENARLYTQISKTPFSDSHLVTLLSHGVCNSLIIFS